ncbi:hypothetical protein CEXT_703311 [Caerostris extrusa]|uniref:Uncharacterized protein n=1 Tax=Caerostris extrusa TaxID=172846 RepID=A0AAV4WJZ9_CAEEX|nr:hypothetical protein CEXT_703311 [Caerostris extrusa]
MRHIPTTRSHDPIKNNRIRFQSITIQKRQEIFPKFRANFRWAKNRANSIILSSRKKQTTKLRDLHEVGNDQKGENK